MIIKGNKSIAACCCDHTAQCAQSTNCASEHNYRECSGYDTENQTCGSKTLLVALSSSAFLYLLQCERAEYATCDSSKRGYVVNVRNLHKFHPAVTLVL